MILIVGGTGSMGRATIRRLLAKGTAVRICSETAVSLATQHGYL